MPARASIRYLAQFALIALCALALRWNALGDPNYQIDETFYLLVGDAMHHGALPYVDIWDRKPPGLFAIYWLAAAAPDPVLGYQLLALLSATLTAWLVRAIAAGLAGPRAGLLAALAYLAMLQPLLGGGGQSPVFYNLPIAAAAALAMRRILVERARHRRVGVEVPEPEDEALPGVDPRIEPGLDRGRNRAEHARHVEHDRAGEH